MATNEELVIEQLPDSEQTIEYAPTDVTSEADRPPTLHALEDPSRRVKRREVEARRYSGKEDVEEYLLQFELTARRNGWGEGEKSAALLCALDGPARGILSEFDDPIAASFRSIKDALLRRFGPTQLVEVHEQALSQLHLAKGQNIRELAHEVQRLTKLAYPDITGPARDHFAVKSLLHAIPDRETVFYIREKNPQNAAEACTLFERYVALTGEEPSHRRAGARAVNQGMPPAPQEKDELKSSDVVTEILQKISDVTSQQLQKLTDAVAQLQSTVSTPVQPVATSSLAHMQAGPRTAPPPPLPQVPRKPCPRCNERGHWARDCPAVSTPPSNVCYRCGQAGHFQRDCMKQLNTFGPMPAPSVGPRLQHRQ